MNKERRQEIFQRFAAHDPNTKSEIHYDSPFELLVAVILSAQATDASVNKATAILFKVANTPKKMLALGKEGLENYIRSIGLYRSKARYIIQASAIIDKDFSGKIPFYKKDLLRLPGVGEKTANVVLNTLRAAPVIAVDTHVFRVSNRTGLARGKTVAEIEKKLMTSTPKNYLVQAHHWLVLHGRYICKARKPLCEQCFIADLCDYYRKERPLQ